MRLRIGLGEKERASKRTVLAGAQGWILALMDIAFFLLLVLVNECDNGPLAFNRAKWHEETKDERRN
jgi:hypothetical protein